MGEGGIVCLEKVYDLVLQNFWDLSSEMTSVLLTIKPTIINAIEIFEEDIYFQKKNKKHVK
ncbi:MAG: hypothetical protein QXE04_01540 [Thermoplasmatales archaeon]